MIRSIIVDRDEEARLHLQNMVGQMHHLTLVKTCESITEATTTLLNDKIDLLFMDFHGDDHNSIDFLKSLNHNKPQIVITTHSKEVASKAFELNASDFVLKPVTEERLLKSISRVFQLSKHAVQELVPKSSVLFIKIGSRLVKVHVDDIFLIEAVASHVNVYTRNETLQVNTTLKMLESKLSSKFFIRVHKSYIVHIGFISEIERDTLTIEKRIVPVGTIYRTKLLEKINII
jgi:two-component system LytT family response regulator